MLHRERRNCREEASYGLVKEEEKNRVEGGRGGKGGKRRREDGERGEG